MRKLRRKRRRESGSARAPKPAPIFDFQASCPGLGGPQRGPERSPQPRDADALGPPITIIEAAALIGCSPWTVRQKFLPMGLPHFRVGRTGRLFFYKSQVIRWLIRREKGEK